MTIKHVLSKLRPSGHFLSDIPFGNVVESEGKVQEKHTSIPKV